MRVLQAPRGITELPSSASVRLAPPLRFKSAETVEWAIASSNPHHGRSDRKSGAMKAGLAYEKKVKAYLSQTFGEAFAEGQWFRFACEGEGHRFCQVDGLLHDVLGPVIIEVKIRWTSDAWWQLKKLYAPVISKALKFPLANISLLTITRSFDPAIPLPEEIRFVDNMKTELWDPSQRVGVHLWKP